MPADAKASSDSGEIRSTRHVSAARVRPTTVGMHDWKTIAPVMLPSASVSLPWRTQMTLLNFSGSSVAMGAMTSARTRGRHAQRAGEVLDRVDEDDRADQDHAQRHQHLERHDPQSRHVGFLAVAGHVQPMKPQRRELGRCAGRARRPSGRP